MRRLLLAVLVVLAREPRATETVVPNDNRVPGGTLDGEVRRLRLVARIAT